MFQCFIMGVNPFFVVILRGHFCHAVFIIIAFNMVLWLDYALSDKYSISRYADSAAA